MRTPMLLATRNHHKMEEIQAILGGSFRCHSLAEFPGAPTLVEDADSFAGNALRKAEQVDNWLHARPARVGLGLETNLWVLADDSGLEVDALNGAPGVLSARFATPEIGSGANAPDLANNRRLLQLLSHTPRQRRTARFRCVLALRGGPPDQRRFAEEARTRLFEGVCEGRIALTPSGRGGFGYDPLFVPEGFDESFAELGEETKNRISHRARALAALRTWFVQKGRSGA